MRYEEEDNRNQENQDYNRNRRPSRHNEAFNDFKSRWDEPKPLFKNQEERDRHHEERRLFQQNDRPNRREEYGRREEWPPRNRQQPDHARHREEHGHHNQGHEPNWRRQDVDFNRDNQHANDRWSQDTSMPHPNQQHGDEFERKQWEREQHRDRQRQRRDGSGYQGEE